MINKVLITGANGFVGQAVCAYAKDYAIPVRGAVRSIDTQLPHLESVIVGDIHGNTDWTEALMGCDTVLHLAARVHVMKEHSSNALEECRRVNVEGTLNLANQAAQAGIKRFVFVSSVKVNGESTRIDHPFSADDVPNPQNPYAISKYEAEQGLFMLGEKTGMEVVIVRPPLIHGPDAKANFATLLKWIANGIPMPLAAIKNNRRSLVSLKNLSDFLFTCLTHPQAANHIFMVSDGDDMSTATLLRQQAGLIGKRVRLFYVPVFMLKIASVVLGKQDIYQRLSGSLQVDIQKNKALLNWSPNTLMHIRKCKHPWISGTAR